MSKPMSERPPRFTKRDERNLRAAHRHHARYIDAMNRIDHPLGEAGFFLAGESCEAFLENVGPSEDSFVAHVKECLEAYYNATPEEREAHTFDREGPLRKP